MKILNNFIEWFGRTELYTECLSRLPDGLNNVYLDAIIVLVFIVIGIIIVCQTIANIIFRMRLKRKSMEREKIKLQIEKERLEFERNSLHNAEDQRLYFQFMQYMMINHITGMTFEQWKNMNQSNQMAEPDNSSAKSETDQPADDTTSESEVQEKPEEVTEPDLDIVETEESTEQAIQDSEMQIDELLPETELIDGIEEDPSPVNMPAVPIEEEQHEITEEIPKEIIDVASIVAEKQKELEQSEESPENTNNFEAMIANIIQHKNDVEQQKELDAEISKITEQNMAVLDEKFTSGLHMETEDIEQHLDQMTDEQIKELEKTRKKIEKEEEKKRKAANRKPLFGKKKDKNVEGGKDDEK